jgi:hypothetical protein
MALGGLRSEVEVLCTAIYLKMGLGNHDDSIALIDHNPECRNISTIVELHKNGLLPTDVAMDLSLSAIGADTCLAAAHGDDKHSEDGEKCHAATSRAPSPGPPESLASGERA